MAALSDQLFVVSLLAYLVAVVAFAAAHALRRAAPSRPRPVPVPAAEPSATATLVAAPAAARLVTPRRAGLSGVAAVVVAALAQAGCLAPRRRAVRPLGLYVAVCAVALLGAVGLHLYTPAGPLVPALQSVWLAVHVSAAAIASGLFLLGFLAAVALLLRARYDARGADRPADLRNTLAARLPAQQVLRRVSFRLHGTGFLVWTFA